MYKKIIGTYRNLSQPYFDWVFTQKDPRDFQAHFMSWTVTCRGQMHVNDVLDKSVGTSPKNSAVSLLFSRKDKSQR